MDYSCIAGTLSNNSCNECEACFPELKKFCDKHVRENTTCEEAIRKYLVFKVEGRITK